MTRFGLLYAGFTEWDDPSTVISSGGVTSLQAIIQAEVTKKKGMMTRGKFVMEMQDDWESFVQQGRIVFLYAGDEVLGDIREMGSFLIEKAQPATEEDGRQTITVSGLGREKLLTRYRHWAPIGEETIIATVLTAAVVAPWSLTVAGEGAPPGNDSVTLSSDAGIEVGDEIRIELNSGEWFVATINGVDLPAADENQVRYEPRIPGAASPGNDVIIRKKWLEVDDVEDIEPGMRLVLTLNSGTHETRVENIDEGRIQVEAGVTGAAAIGKAVTVYDYSEPALDDVEQIMTPATGWTLKFQNAAWHGTAEGTAHAPKGESAWELLVATAERSGEFFRVAPLTGGRPVKRLDWYRTADGSAMTLILYTGLSQSALAAATDDPDIGIIYKIARDDEHNVVTRIYPLTSDGLISLSYCSAEALAAAAADGYTVVLSDDLYEPDYVQYGPGVTEHGVLSDVVRYGDIQLSDAAETRVGVSELKMAADSLLAAAMATLRESQERRFVRMKAHMHRPLWPGQTVTVTNPAMEPYVNEVMHVLEVREVLEKGLIMSYLLLSSEPEQQVTPVRSLARALRSTQQAARRSSAGAARSVTVGGSTGGGSDHGGLTGLTDDDHPQYLRADGTRALVGNLAANAGVTIDGVDLSVHAANPAAHHALVTAADGSITVSGQAVRIADAAAGDGLSLTSGVLAVKTAAGMGTGVTSDTVAVVTESAGGLSVGISGVKVLRPTNSGLAADGTGLYLVPGTVGAATTNANSGTGHTHAVTATENSLSGVGQLMKSSAAGDHTLRYLTASKVVTPLVESLTDLTLDPAYGLALIDGNLRFKGGTRYVQTETGDLFLAPAAELLIAPVGNVTEVQPSVTLKTAHWSSGFLGTGWGLTYDGHLDTRSIYADELHVAAFIADTARVKVGSEYITPSMALLADDFTIPAVGATGTLVVEDAPGLANLPVFDDKDWVLLRIMNRAGGGLLVANVWGQVAGYVDGPGVGQQRWTFTTKSTTAAGQVAAGGSVALDFGKSGAGWWWVTAIDPAGSPYAGITTWSGANPYTEGNRSHVLRMGQLRGVTGVYEWGLQAGLATSRKIRFSDLASEIHGTRLSLYAGDGAELRLGQIEVLLYRTAGAFSTLQPDADHAAVNVTSSGGSYYGTIDEGFASANMADYIANGTNTAGYVYVGLGNPSPWGAIYGVQYRARVQGVGFSNDTVSLYAQVFASDEVTALTDEVRVYQMAGNTTTNVTGSWTDVDTAATQAQWNAARLRLRWEYVISSSDEAIRLDPQVPSIAVGNPIPTGQNAGGNGFWVGRDAGVYKLRLGATTGVGLRWDGSNLYLHNKDNQAVITLGSDGTSEFARAMTIGTSGGIWQGTAGTFAAPKGGLKLWNNAGVGTLEFFDDTGGRPLRLNKAGITLRNTVGYDPGGIGEITFVNSSEQRVAGIDTYYAGLNNMAVSMYAINPGGSMYNELTISPLGTYLRNYESVSIVSGSGATPNSLTVSPADISIGTANNTVNLYGALYLQSGGALMIPRTSTMVVPPGRAAIYVYKNGAVNQLIFQSGPSLQQVIGSLAYT